MGRECAMKREDEAEASVSTATGPSLLEQEQKQPGTSRWLFFCWRLNAWREVAVFSFPGAEAHALGARHT